MNAPVLALLVAALVALGSVGVGVVEGRLSRGRAKKIKLIPKYYAIRHCDNRPCGMRVFNVTKHLDRDGVEYVDGELEMFKQLNVIKTLTLVVHRCTGGMAPNQCEYFNRWSWSAGICALISAKGMPWSPAFNSMTPAFKCPVTVGLRHVRNASLDLDALVQWDASMTLDKHIWPFELQLHNEADKLAFCVQGIVEYHRILIKRDSAS
ncbi:uncharacterized protein LOC113205680 [Frankliniella occidentalis]|uniref:Uncharacterized protein LOC113205680 n=1 Tax=Frankliniella occidentalis TaxID=133901 RepID=A0A6J1SEX7_FRAOC|nr:uncharacterized protein LOC113205680 [Frankliniella occidentalis]